MTDTPYHAMNFIEELDKNMCNETKSKKLLNYLGRVKTRASRMAIYYQFFQLAMTIYIAAQVGFNWWLLLLAIPGFVIVYLFEVRHGITAEMDIVWRASTEWNEFKKKDEEFKKHLLTRFPNVVVDQDDDWTLQTR